MPKKVYLKCEDKLADWRYAVCFRQRAGLCGLQLSAQQGQFILNSGLAVQEEAVGPDCHNFTINSNNDYIQVGDYGMMQHFVTGIGTQYQSVKVNCESFDIKF